MGQADGHRHRLQRGSGFVVATAACYGARSAWSVAADVGSEAPGICWIDVPGFWSALRACCCGVSGGVLRSSSCGLVCGFLLREGACLPC